MAKKTTPKIPALPYGEGSMYLTKDDTVEYKKVIKRGDGRKVRKTVHGSTARECIAKMKIVEMEERRAYSEKREISLHTDYSGRYSNLSENIGWSQRGICLWP